MEQDAAARLRGHRDGNTDQVGRETRPDIGFDLWDGIPQIRLNLQTLFGWNEDIFSFHVPGYSQPAEYEADHIQVLIAGIVNAQLAVGHYGCANKTDHFQVIRPNGELASVQALHALYMQRIGADSGDFGPQRI